MGMVGLRDACGDKERKGGDGHAVWCRERKGGENKKMGELGTLVKALEESWTVMHASRKEIGNGICKGVFMKMR